MAEELRAERGKLPEASKKSEFARDLFMAKKRAELNPAVYAERYALFFARFLEIAFVLKTISSYVIFRQTAEYWNNLIPCTGRPMSAAICCQRDPHCVPKALTQ